MTFNRGWDQSVVPESRIEHVTRQSSFCIARVCHNSM
jgi:hypothetical protein